MKPKLLSLLILIISFTLFAKPVDENRAKIVALHFLNYKANSSLLKRVSTLQLTYTFNSKLNNTTDEKAMFYVFNINTFGYIIVSADDTVTPILGYSTESNFNYSNIPPSMQKWLENYKKQILYILENDVNATDEITNLWSSSKTNDKTSNSTLNINAVSPLIQTKWDQSPFVNALCPNNSVTGCVATAMAQIMKFWNYPATGSGFYSYNTQQYGTLSANFGNTTYQWNAMPNIVNSPNTAVATLMFHCGVSVDMNYSPQSSGAAGAIRVQPALVNYFGYQNSIISSRADFTDSNWINLLKTELNQGRPMYYEGFGGGSGHAFVCDGFNNNDFFHMNWGWGNLSTSHDGYFQVNALNPNGLGTGGGAGSYNSNQKIVRNIQPPTTAINYNLSLYNNLTPSSSTIGYGNPITVTTNIANNGTNTFSGDYTVGVFDSNNNFVDYVETKVNYGALQAGFAYTNNIVFSNTGLFSMLPGTYTLGLYYRVTGGNWKIVQNSGGFTNFTQITIINPNPLKLNSVINVTPSNSITQGQNTSVNLNIINNGTSTFVGQYKVGLYNLNGTFVQDIATINETNGLPVGFTYNSPFLNFNTTNITANPGSYLLALQHKTVAGNWILTGSTTTFINPIKVTVVQAPYLSDTYEVNNSISQSYNLPITFSGNNANVNTIGSNCHIITDNDFYKITLPSGFNYTVTPRLQDSYNSNNGSTYTLDALFSYSTDGVNWSSSIDDVIVGNIIINNGGTLYFRTAPYFQGNTGTYLLDIILSRTTALGINENRLAENIEVYPNPTKDFVIINTNDFKGELNQINLINIQGQKIFTFYNNNESKIMQLLVSNFADGIYMLQFHTSEGILTKKLIINK